MTQLLTNQKKILSLIYAAIQRKKIMVKEWEHCDQANNPQILEIKNTTKGEIRAMENIADALRGYFTNLRIDAKGILT